MPTDQQASFPHATHCREGSCITQRIYCQGSHREPLYAPRHLAYHRRGRADTKQTVLETAVIQVNTSWQPKPQVLGNFPTSVHVVLIANAAIHVAQQGASANKRRPLSRNYLKHRTKVLHEEGTKHTEPCAQLLLRGLTIEIGAYAQVFTLPYHNRSNKSKEITSDNFHIAMLHAISSQIQMSF